VDPDDDNRSADELLAAIDDDPDKLHADYTPAVWALSHLGWEVAPRLLDLMLADSAETRMHAARALELIVDRAYGFVAGQGFPGQDAEEQARVLWMANGGYRYDTDASTRAEAVRLWRRWLASRAGEGGRR
jgi:hypothetical protein